LKFKKSILLQKTTGVLLSLFMITSIGSIPLIEAHSGVKFYAESVFAPPIDGVDSVEWAASDSKNSI